MAFVDRDRATGEFYTTTAPDGSRVAREFPTLDEAWTAADYFSGDADILAADEAPGGKMFYIVASANGRYYTRRNGRVEWTSDIRAAHRFGTPQEAEIAALGYDGNVVQAKETRDE